MTVVQQAAGIALTLASLWPLWLALDAVARRDWLGALLLMAGTWLVARSGLELTAGAQKTPTRKA
jgi:hypothetical protein